MNITDFISARLDEEERIAKAIDDKQWDSGWRTEASGYRRGHALIPHVGNVHEAEAAAHIVAQGPDRALLRVAALRRMASWHPPTARNGTQECSGCAEDCHSMSGLGCPVPVCHLWPCDDLRALASIWSDHPGYNPEWSLS